MRAISTSKHHDACASWRHARRRSGLVQLAVRCGRLRASPHVYNTDREIDQLVEALPKH